MWLPELKEEKEALLDRIANDDYWDPTMAGEAWKGEDAPHHEEQGEQWKNDREKRKKGLKKAVEAMMAKYTNIDPLKKMLEVGIHVDRCHHPAGNGRWRSYARGSGERIRRPPH